MGIRIAKFRDSPINVRLRGLIKQNNVDVTELASRLNVSVSAVSQWLQGYSRPDIDKLQDIAVFFSVSVRWLLDLDCNVRDYDIDSESAGNKYGLSTNSLLALRELSQMDTEESIAKSGAIKVLLENKTGQEILENIGNFLQYNYSDSLKKLERDVYVLKIVRLLDELKDFW